MSFTDEDIKRLKEASKRNVWAPDWPEEWRWLHQKFNALLARLEAAEKVAEASEVYRIYRRDESGIFDKPNQQVKDLDAAIFEWRKACGKDGGCK